MKTQKETPGNVEQYDKYQSLSYDELVAHKIKKLEDLIIKISEEIMDGKLPNLAKTDEATNILKFYQENLENK